MNRMKQSMIVSLFSAAILNGAVARADLLIYTGTDSNWHNPSNWNLGRLPSMSDDVLIDSGNLVIIDPSRGTPEVAIRDITIASGGRLETLAGTVLTTRNETINSGFLYYRSTRALDDRSGGTLNVLPRGTGQGGPWNNPTYKRKHTVNFNSNIVFFGLGGVERASDSPDGIGAGHYANLSCHTLNLNDCDLDLQLFYGFTPSPGQFFEIISIDSTRNGLFNGLGEGSLMKTLGDVGLYISYVGGDGNDVVLSAAVVPAPGAASLLALGGLLASRRRR